MRAKEAGVLLAGSLQPQHTELHAGFEGCSGDQHGLRAAKLVLA